MLELHNLLLKIVWFFWTTPESVTLSVYMYVAYLIGTFLLTYITFVFLALIVISICMYKVYLTVLVQAEILRQIL